MRGQNVLKAGAIAHAEDSAASEGQTAHAESADQITQKVGAEQITQAEPAGQGTAATGVAKKNPTAFLCFGIGLVVAIVLAAAALFDFGPFAGEGFLAFAGWVLAAALHGSSAALLLNLAHPQPPTHPKTVIGHLSRHNLPDSRWWTLLPLVPVLAATIAFGYWVAQLNLEARTNMGYIISTIIGVGALAVPTGKASIGKSRRVKYAGATTGGTVTGVIVSLAVLVVSSVYRHEHLNNVSFSALRDVPLHGAYVALGDSYAAGEGLAPFEPDTSRAAATDPSTTAIPGC
jgi:hypothetical protein